MRRRGATRGLVAVAHSLLLVIYHVLERDTEYHDLGPEFLDRMREKQLVRFHLKRLQQLDLSVTVQRLPA
jgi:transposase